MQVFRLLVVCFALLLGSAGCGSSDKATEPKTVMPEVRGKRLDVALGDIKKAGFEDDVDVSSTGTFGVVDETNWTVCEQTPAAGKPVGSPPKLDVDRSCEDEQTEPTESTTTVASTTSDAPTTSEVPTTTAADPAADEVLTPANNADLATLLTEGNNCDDSIGQFAANYRGRTIEFDGNIADMAPHGDASTRFDILIYAGDFDPASATGPSFQFRDVNIVSDLGLTGPNIPDTLEQGINLRFKAELGDFDADSCLFLLAPITTTMR